MDASRYSENLRLYVCYFQHRAVKITAHEKLTVLFKEYTHNKNIF